MCFCLAVCLCSIFLRKTQSDLKSTAAWVEGEELQRGGPSLYGSLCLYAHRLPSNGTCKTLGCVFAALPESCLQDRSDVVLLPGASQGCVLTHQVLEASHLRHSLPSLMASYNISQFKRN